ncbi:hypothetical protein TanjilG_27956 [Lupinus angustifolius]|uniref:PIPK domain-containing protein n=1 Tax=Lupinus angustifolius TaxID=3871 RepID=A0A4P1RGA4_LUPAN|nr:hypothetical protein TanjilG_27956 [Lupinus angustifolius]
MLSLITPLESRKQLVLASPVQMVLIGRVVKKCTLQLLHKRVQDKVPSHLHHALVSGEEIGDSGKHFISPSRTYCDNYSDIDSNSVSARHNIYNYNSVGSRSSESPSRIGSTCRVENVLSDSHYNILSSDLDVEPEGGTISNVRNLLQPELQEAVVQEERGYEVAERMKDKMNEDGFSGEYFSATDAHQSILVYFSSHCVSKGAICERTRLMRIKFYGSFDKPLGRYLCDDLFGGTSYCQSCKEPVEGHVLCFMHRQGNLTINVQRLPSVKLPGERDGKIWMWHRCLRCPHVDGVPPETPRVIMSDAAWGLSFGKFLELRFSNHSTANRVTSCGHSLQRDCLRFYGFGRMVAFFRYSPVDVLSVHLPPSVLEFGHIQEEWIRKEAGERFSRVEILYVEISDVLERLETKIASPSTGNELSDTFDILNHVLELKDMLQRERTDYHSLLQSAPETPQPGKVVLDILELNCLRRSLLIGSHVWDHRLNSLDSLIKRSLTSKVKTVSKLCAEVKELRVDSFHKDRSSDSGLEQNNPQPLKLCESDESHMLGEQDDTLEPCVSDAFSSYDLHGEFVGNKTLSPCFPPDESNLPEKIDSAWIGTDHHLSKVEPLHTYQPNSVLVGSVLRLNQNDNPPFRRLKQPVRVQSFDSALRVQKRMGKVWAPSSHLLQVRSFHATGDYRNVIKDPVSNVVETNIQMLPWETQKLKLILSSKPSFISSMSLIADGARLLIPETHNSDRVIAVYDNDYSSIISHALSSKEYEDGVSDKSDVHYGNWDARDRNREDSATSSFSAWASLDLDYINYGNYGSEAAAYSIGSLLKDSKQYLHLQVSFGDDSLGAGVTKTELDSFEEFAPQYFKYLMNSMNSGCPTCLAKILGIYQVIVMYPKGGKETKIDLMVMENLFFNRKISRVYDLKGSERSRYNSDTSGANKVMLDMNLLETLRTKPIYLGIRAKRRLERAVWNDTFFLASVKVMDYSLLVGVDDDRKELVVGIIDFVRQYTWDKHLETWVKKASGILGGLKKAAPTIVAPKQYKKRFRKAMTTYFLTLPDHWSSS